MITEFCSSVLLHTGNDPSNRPLSWLFRTPKDRIFFCPNHAPALLPSDEILATRKKRGLHGASIPVYVEQKPSLCVTMRH